jgi:aspartate-semialdehyde dehydrogenase
MSANGGYRPRIAIVGASGTVGGQIASLIRERGFPYTELKLFGSDADVSVEVEAGDEVLGVDPLKSSSELAAFDIAFLALPSAAAASILAAAPGPILIDLSGADSRSDGAAPVVAPGLTPRTRISELKLQRRFAVPHPVAQVIATVLRALEIDAGFAGAAVLLAAASGGRKAIAALFNQSVDVLNTRLDLEDDAPQTAFNVFLPTEADAIAQTIATQVAALGGVLLPAVQIAYVPAFHGGAVALFLPPGPALEDARTRLRDAPGIVLVESGEASSFVDAATQEAVIAKLTVAPAGATLWCVFDPARVAALAALWIAETLNG